MLSADHFRRLYRQLPGEITEELLSPFELLRLNSTDSWVRSYFRRYGTGVQVYLLDAHNRVLKEVFFADEILQRIGREETDLEASLDDIDQLRSRIYSALDFFLALEQLSEEAQRSVVADPGRLLNLPGPVRRVGISDEALSGFVDIGFEFQDAGQPRVIILQARDWAVWQLRLALENEAAGVPPALQN
jgi:hypothetical protein